jgi:hypothetical protein
VAEPVAAWGVMVQDDAQDLWAPLNNHLLGQQGLRCVQQVPVVTWASITGLPQGWNAAKSQYQARAVVELKDQQTVNQLVVQPLLAEVAALRQEGRESVGVASV